MFARREISERIVWRASGRFQARWKRGGVGHSGVSRMGACGAAASEWFVYDLGERVFFFTWCVSGVRVSWFWVDSCGSFFVFAVMIFGGGAVC